MGVGAGGQREPAVGECVCWVGRLVWLQVKTFMGII